MGQRRSETRSMAPFWPSRVAAKKIDDLSLKFAYDMTSHPFSGVISFKAKVARMPPDTTDTCFHYQTSWGNNKFNCSSADYNRNHNAISSMASGDLVAALSSVRRSAARSPHRFCVQFRRVSFSFLSGEASKMNFHFDFRGLNARQRSKSDFLNVDERSHRKRKEETNCTNFLFS